MKEKQLQAAIQQITKKFGKETVMWLGRDSHRHVDVISTGSLSLDIALGVGGLPKVTLLYSTSFSLQCFFLCVYDIICVR